MIVWVYITIATFGSGQLNIAGDMRYAFKTKAACEEVIKDMEMMRCIPLEVK